MISDNVNTVMPFDIIMILHTHTHTYYMVTIISVISALRIQFSIFLFPLSSPYLHQSVRTRCSSRGPRRSLQNEWLHNTHQYPHPNLIVVIVKRN